MMPEVFDAVDQSNALNSGALSSLELVTRQLDIIGTEDRRLGAFVTVDAEGAEAAAVASDRRRAQGRSLGPLDGLTIAVKDMIATRGMTTTANSRVSPGLGFTGAADAPSVAQLRRHGAIIIGKSTTYEYAAGLPDPATGFAVPKNPWNPEHTPSGSSTGSSIAVVVGMASAALGTDTGGSIRAPAATTGHTGFKPTTGSLPNAGVVPLSPSLDVLGPMARSARDCSLVYGTLAEVSPAEAGATGLRGVSLGIPRNWFWDHPSLQPAVAASCTSALAVLASLGAEVHDVHWEHSALAPQANHLIVVSEAFALHRARLRANWGQYGRHTRLTFARGALVGAADYVQAQRFRRAFTKSVVAAFERCDLLVTPTMPEVAARADGISITNRMAMANFVSPFSLAGLPAVSIPVAADPSGLPIGLQIVGRPHADAMVLRVAEAVQEATDWHRASSCFDAGHS